MSLYRKYRPQTFEDVVGQEHVARTLRNALTASPPRVAHAYLFTGPRGIGKTTNARLLAKCLNCATGPTPRPCNQCDFCTRVANNQPVMDMIEIDAASNTGVDNIRDVIIDKVNVAPAEGRYRIYIIDEVHMLSNSSFNALLKTLEEPPPHAIFILATTDSHKVPATITSRCQRFDFRRVGPNDIVKRLHYVAQCEGFQLHEDAARLIARHAEGALRDALTLLEQVSAYSSEEITGADVRLVLGGVPQELIHELVTSVATGDAFGVLQSMEKAVDEGASFLQLSRDLTAYFRDLLLLTVGYQSDEGLAPAEQQLRQQHASQIGRAKLEAVIASLREAEKEMRQSTDHRLLLELTLVRATEAAFGAATAVATPALRPVPSQPVRRPVVPPAPVVEQISEPAPAAPPVIATPAPAPAPVEEVVPPPAMEDAPQQETAPPVEAPVEEDTVPPVPVATIQETETPPPPAEEPANGSPKKKGRRIGNYEELVELWPALLMRIRKKIGVTAVAYLHDARPIAFTDEDVVLEFHKEFHHAKATEASGRLPFEDTINEVLDKKRRLRFQLAAPKPVEIQQEEEAPPSDDDDEWDQEDIIEYTQSIFGAEIMGRSG
jgi:DNA polymerase-3 subunit gamma/tau